MSGAAIRVKVDTAALQDAFDEVLKRGRNLRPLMTNIGEYLLAETDDRFDEEKGPDGRVWEKSIRAKEEGGKTLTDHRHLRDSIASGVSERSVTIGSNRVYAAIHQFGGTIKAKNGGRLKFPVGAGYAQVSQVEMPARPFLGVNDGDVEEIKVLISDHVLRGQH